MRTKLAGALALFLVGAAACGREVAAPEVAMTREGPVLRLPPAMRRALDSYAPGFRAWRLEDYGREAVEAWTADPTNALFGVVGDFNGDGVRDVALDGHDGTYSYRFVILSSDSATFTIRELRRKWRRSPREWNGQKKPDFFLPARPGVVRGPESLEPEPLRLETDALHLVYDSQASVVLYWREGCFREYFTGD